MCRVMFLAFIIGVVLFTKSGYAECVSFQRPEYSSFLVTVQIYPKHIHSCSGFFISSTFVLVPASCIDARRTENLKVALTNTITGSVTLMPVISVFIYPEYFIDVKMDLALLEINEPDIPKQNIPIFEIPDSRDPSDDKLRSFQWLFNEDQMPDKLTYDYVMMNATVLPDNECLEISDEYLKNTFICAAIGHPLSLAARDLGVPLVSNSNTSLKAYGLFTTPITDESGNNAMFLYLLPLKSWIYGTSASNL